MRELKIGVSVHWGQVAFGALVLGLLVGPAQAQKASAPSNNPLEVSLARTKIAIENGKEVSRKADVAKPGDIIEEIASYKNNSAGDLKDFVPMLPVPPNTELILGSIKPANAKASADGKNFSDMPLKRKVRQANGVEVEQPVPLAEYRFLRWYPGDIGAGKTLVFSARFKLSDGAPVAAAPNKK